MKHLTSAKLLATLAIGFGAITAASSAQARSDVFFSIGLPASGVYVQSGPMYMPPAPLYVQSAPVYVQPQPYYPRAVEYYPSAPQYNWRAPEHHWRHDEGRHNGRGQWQSRGPNGDLDRDGIANRYDHDRDGDGVRNRHDRLPDNPNRR